MLKLYDPHAWRRRLWVIVLIEVFVGWLRPADDVRPVN
jgi:hypothetical protein